MGRSTTRAAVAAVSLSILAVAGASTERVALAGSDTKACAGLSEEGQRQRAAGKLVAARDLFKTCSRETCPGIIREDCTSWLKDLESSIPTVVVVVRDDAGKDVSASVTIDGTSSVVPDGLAMPIDPGPHKLSATVGGRTVETTATINMGEKNRQLLITIPSAAAASRPNAPETSTSAPATSTTPDTKPSYTLPIVGLVIAGVGVLALGTGVLFEVTAKDQDNKSTSLLLSAADEVDKNPACAASPPDRTACPVNDQKYTARQAALQDQTTAFVLWGVGAAALIGGGVLAYVTWPRASAKSGWFQVVPSVTQRQSSLAIVGQF
jgi:hypothetical protein